MTNNRLIEYFSKITPLTEDEKHALAESMEIKHCKKNDYLLKAGQNNQNTFFVLNGFIRQYKLIDGEEITTNFYKEGQWIISFTSFENSPISESYLLCVEDSSVVLGNEQKAQELFARHPRFETISRIVMEKVFAEQQKWMLSYQTDTPEKRYLRLLETQPDVFQKVPQYQIASFIGVMPETLSRIRNRIKKIS
jgi:CRP-like cAMP-binding protein